MSATASDFRSAISARLSAPRAPRSCRSSCADTPHRWHGVHYHGRLRPRSAVPSWRTGNLKTCQIGPLLAVRPTVTDAAAVAAIAAPLTATPSKSVRRPFVESDAHFQEVGHDRRAVDGRRVGRRWQAVQGPMVGLWWAPFSGDFDSKWNNFNWEMWPMQNNKRVRKFLGQYVYLLKRICKIL